MTCVNWGWILIIVGIVFALDSAGVFASMDVWPFILIGFGVWLVYRQKDSLKSKKIVKKKK